MFRPNTRRGSCHTVTGTDYLTAISIGPTPPTQAGILLTTKLNPRTLLASGNTGDSWLAKMAQLYEKFQFKSLEFHYHPAVGTVTGGQLFMCVDNDVDDDFTGIAGGPLLSSIRALKYSVFFPVYGDSKQQGIVLKITDPTFFNQVLYCDTTENDDRWAYAGSFFMGTTGVLDADLTYGSIDIRYTVEFSSPNIDSYGNGAGITGAKSTTTEQSHIFPFGQTWIPGTQGTAIWSNVPVTMYKVVPGTATQASVFIFDQPGVYQFSWEHTGSSLNTTAPVLIGSTSLVNGTYAYTFNTSTREAGSFYLNVAEAGTGFYATHALGPTILSVKCYISVTSQVPSKPAPGPMSKTMARKAEELTRLLEAYKKMTTSDALEEVDLSISLTTTGESDPLNNQPVPFSSTTTGSITGTILTPDPPGLSKSAFIRQLIENPALAHKASCALGTPIAPLGLGRGQGDETHTTKL